MHNQIKMYELYPADTYILRHLFIYLFFSFKHNEFCFKIMECFYAACIAVACVCRCLYALNAVILSTAAQ